MMGEAGEQAHASRHLAMAPFSSVAGGEGFSVPCRHNKSSRLTPSPSPWTTMTGTAQVQTGLCWQPSQPAGGSGVW